jgi:phage recombination protein Bet
VPTQFDSEQRELVRRTVAKGATDDELELYLYDCKRRNVHPLDKLLHFTKRSGRYVPVTSIDLFRSRAAETGELAGSDDALFVEEVGKPPIAATVTVYRITGGQRFPYTATARWSEYNPGGDMWRKMPHTMLAKCAEALALRKAFPQELGGLYTNEEMAQASRRGESAQQIADEDVAAERDHQPAPPHDPETGELIEPQPAEPCAINAPDGAYRTFGQIFIAAIRTSTSLEIADKWRELNVATLDAMAQEAPKMYSVLKTAEAKARTAMATDAELTGGEARGCGE